jgi:hypothetical protein
LAGSVPEEFGTGSARLRPTESPDAVANTAIDACLMNVRRAIISSSLES